MNAMGTQKLITRYRLQGACFSFRLNPNPLSGSAHVADSVSGSTVQLRIGEYMKTLNIPAMSNDELIVFIRLHTKDSHAYARLGFNPVTPDEIEQARAILKSRNREAFNRDRALRNFEEQELKFNNEF